MNLHDAFTECLEIGNDYVHVENDGDFFVKREGDTLELFFEESDGVRDWIHNFKFIAVPKKPYKGMEKTWFCHRGFFKVFGSILPYIKEEILNPKNKKFKVVGYSHGAAIALLCYEYIKYHRPDAEIEGVGFGAPRVFWGIVPKEVKERCRGFTVVRNGKDIVTHVPPVLFGYHHISRVLKVGKGKSEGLVDDHRPEGYLSNL